ncbi:uncharacterized protein TRIADDRAFT_54475 [Trichoplax adhaerens]|uniref:Nuclear cap-binding protein subunit 1 n=1 Tax=Trichoplax adhaerens TaxID=10228 RepID=B3RS52_TRIAD|nr:hypothetical protein TRIADDRAFT_54475 [Trichoplax adhaerens]EDV26456.1 hypothetical protein TRIADDRAFT_54475 [Trichoplax adhaerens]|eukprot:XP_002110452.1 hypothetical protein TRIADDRAFT_54475 [Trichoplax adhaerens]
MSRRRYHDSDDEYDHRQAKRFRRSNNEPKQIEDRLESLIFRVGEKSSSSLETNLEKLAGVLQADIPNYKQKILDTLYNSVTLLPFKVSIYSTLIGLLNAKNYKSGEEFVNMAVANLEQDLMKGQFEPALIKVRLLADMVNAHVISSTPIMIMFSSFVGVTKEPDIPQARSDWFVYAVLSALPWVGRQLFKEKGEDLANLMSSIDSYIKRRKKPYLSSLYTWKEKIYPPQEDYLDCLWQQIKDLKSNGWKERYLHRPYRAFDDILVNAFDHTFPIVTIPHHDDDVIYPLPKVTFRLIKQEAESETVHCVERYIMEESIRTIMKSMYKNRKECASRLLSLPSRSRLSLYDTIIETIFSDLFTLPKSVFPELFTSSLLIELCKSEPTVVPKVLAEATGILYDRVDIMNVTCVHRFASWFSYHLSNFQYKWSWNDWEDCLNQESSPKRRFVSEVLEKCVRLAYFDRIVEIITEPLVQLLPPEPSPKCKFERSDAESTDPAVNLAQQLFTAFKAKKSPEEVIEVLESAKTSLFADNEDEYAKTAAEVLVQCVLSIGQKSISHATSGITKFKTVFKAIIKGGDEQIICLNSMFSVWERNIQILELLLDKMLRLEIIEPSSVINWLLSRDMLGSFQRFFVWNIVHHCLRKCSKRLRIAKRELQDVKEKFSACSNSEDTTDEERSKLSNAVDNLSDEVYNAYQKQKEVFLILFQRFIIILNDHLYRREQDQSSPWLSFALEKLKEVMHMYYEEVFSYKETLEQLLFTSETDSRILRVFTDFCSLRD